MKLLTSLILCLSLALSPLAALAGGAMVNINTADAKTLAKSIKGVGDKKAKAIVVYRARHGRFKSVDELKKVKGIGSGTVDRNRPNLTVGQGAH
jgi:competence protein ComEA